MWIVLEKRAKDTMGAVDESDEWEAVEVFSTSLTKTAGKKGVRKSGYVAAQSLRPRTRFAGSICTCARKECT